CLVAFGNAFAQVDFPNEIAEKELNERGEVVFRFLVEDPAVLNDLTWIISIEKVKNKEVWASANQQEFADFLKYQIDYTVIPNSPFMVDTKNDLTEALGIWEFDTYPTYPQYEMMMNTFADDFPEICQLDTLTILPSGRMLLAIKITDNVNQHEDEPEFLYSSTMHGNELVGYVTMLRLIDHLTNNYGTDLRITNLVNNTEIWICPLANPDGTYAGGNMTISGAKRRNANNVDLNRNFPNPVAGQHPDNKSWQPETIAMMDFADDHDFVLSSNIHTGAEVVNYPWDTWTSAQNVHADDDWWQLVGHEFADTVQYYGPPGYYTDVTSSGVSEGGDWYVVYGSRQDYMQYYQHCREFTLEISSTHIVPQNSLPGFWEYNYRSLLNYIEQSLYGVRGVVTDACTGAPLKALISVNAHDSDSSQVYSSLPLGNYHRPIYEGTYSFTFFAPGYESQTISNISVVNEATVLLNVQLIPVELSLPESEFIIANTGLDIDLTNLSNNASTYEWNFGDGNTSTEEHPSHSYLFEGEYTITLISANECKSDTSHQSITIVGATATSTPFDDSEILIFPNPTAGMLNFDLNTLRRVEVIVVDIAGRQHFRRVLQGEEYIDLSFLPDGFYQINIKSDSRTITKPLVLSRK
ncbi:MAG: T9SS C-terminal target domain-containing protein, partial [Bacteroidetes bacterium]